MRSEFEIQYFTRVFGRQPNFKKLLEQYRNGTFNPQRVARVDVTLPDVWIEPGQSKNNLYAAWQNTGTASEN